MGYLTGPVNTLQDFQVEFNGLLMGPGTTYDVPPSWHFLDMASNKSMDQARVWADGSWSGPDFADVLTPEMNVSVASADQATFVAAVNALQKVFVHQTTPAPLWIKLPGMDARGIPAKTSKRSLPIDLGWPRVSEGAVQWRCPDPVWQSVPRTITLVPSGSAVSGLVYPLFTPNSGTYTSPGALNYGLTQVGAVTGTLTNAGNSPAYPVVTINGPTTGSFSVIIDGNYVTYNQPVQAGTSLTIDYKAGTATLNGGIDRTYALTSRDFTPVTSTSTVVYVTSTGITSTANITVADVWR